MTRTLAIVVIFAALLFAQFIGAARQPLVGSVEEPVAHAPGATTVEVDQRALEDLAAWPATR
jgi:hypothetical protein